MGFDRRGFLRTLGGGAALTLITNASAGSPPTEDTAGKAKDDSAGGSSGQTPSYYWSQRYAIDTDAPRLKPPIDIFDIIEMRLAHPHPELFDAKADTMIGRKEINQAAHAYQSAHHAMKQGWNDDVVTAALLHDLGKVVSYEKHSWFSAEMIKPYVSEKIYWITKVHFDIGYAMYPDLEKVPKKTRFLFTDNNRDRIGLDPEVFKKNPNYVDGTRVRESDDAGRTPHERPQIIPELRKIIAKTFKLSKQGLGYDGAPCDELWKLMIEPCWLS